VSTPKTRIPKVVRSEVRLALECWKDYLVAIGNKNGASIADDVVRILGLEPLPHINGINRFDYSGLQIKQMILNVESMGHVERK
jgi:hypothetical protein